MGNSIHCVGGKMQETRGRPHGRVDSVNGPHFHAQQRSILSMSLSSLIDRSQSSSPLNLFSFKCWVRWSFVFEKSVQSGLSAKRKICQSIISQERMNTRASRPLIMRTAEKGSSISINSVPNRLCRRFLGSRLNSSPPLFEDDCVVQVELSWSKFGGSRQ